MWGKERAGPADSGNWKVTLWKGDSTFHNFTSYGK